MLKRASTSTILFDGEIEKFELFRNLFHTSLKVQTEMTDAMKINYFEEHLQKDDLQTFREIYATNKRFLEDVLIVFLRNYVNPKCG